MGAKPPPSWMVRANIALLRRGFSVGTQHLLTVSGNKSGEARSTPVSLATFGGRRYIVAAFGNANWVKNVRAAGAGTLSIGKHHQVVQLTEIPTAERAPVLRAFLEQVRGGRRFFAEGTADEVVAAAERYPVFLVSG
jgi:deazaflavin-dependent oxidoreductase (nitroreductase family)